MARCTLGQALRHAHTCYRLLRHNPRIGPVLRLRQFGALQCLIADGYAMLDVAASMVEDCDIQAARSVHAAAAGYQSQHIEPDQPCLYCDDFFGPDCSKPSGPVDSRACLSWPVSINDVDMDDCVTFRRARNDDEPQHLKAVGSPAKHALKV